MAEPASGPPRLSRRGLLGGAAVAVGMGGIGWGTAQRSAVAGAADSTFGADTVEFYGPHQAGIATPGQAHALFVAFDLPDNADRTTVESILRLWSTDAARLTAGRPALADTEPELAAHPARLTVTVGFGPRLFTVTGTEAVRPASVQPLPAFGIDRLDERWSGGDLLVQICGDDPTSCSHAQRVLTKNVRTITRVRWIQRGFRDARGTQPAGTTMRNLLGQVDGTVNPADTEFDELVWADGRDRPWFAGGTTLVLRRIRTELDTWDEVDREGRELTIGRRLDNGAPLTGTAEHDKPDFAALADGIPVIPPNAHIARAHHSTPDERFLRRSYNYDDPPEPNSGSVSNAGLIFAAYQRDIDTQFLPVQRRLADADLLNTWTTPIGSAVFAIPPGIAPGEYLGQTLLEQR